MRYRAKVLTVVALLLLLVGCATTKVKSVRSPEFSGSIESVFVVVKVAAASPDTFATVLASGLDSDLQTSGVRVDVRTMTGLELKDPDYEAEIEEFDPGYVMFVIQTGLTSSSGGDFAGATFDASIVSMQTGERVWRASIKASSDWRWVGATSIAKSVRTKLMEQLVADKIIADTKMK